MTFAPPTPDENGCCPTCGQPFTITAMSDALSAERARVIEECAKVVENTITGTSNIDVIEQRGADKAAAALRALGQQDTGETA